MSIDTDTKVEILKDKIARDEWTSHIKIDKSAIIQLSTLLDKYDFSVSEIRSSTVYDAMVRFYVFGYMTGSLQQKWKDEGLIATEELKNGEVKCNLCGETSIACRHDDCPDCCDLCIPERGKSCEVCGHRYFIDGIHDDSMCNPRSQE